jgi:hypothetical protein
LRHVHPFYSVHYRPRSLSTHTMNQVDQHIVLQVNIT